METRLEITGICNFLRLDIIKTGEWGAKTISRTKYYLPCLLHIYVLYVQRLTVLLIVKHEAHQLVGTSEML